MSGQSLVPALNVLFCAVSDEFETMARRALARGHFAAVSAADPSAARRLLGALQPSIVVMGGASDQAVANSCEEIREIAAERCSVVLAIVPATPKDTRLLLDAGADDILLESLDETALRSRLSIAERAVARMACCRAVETDSARFFRLSRQLLCVVGLDGHFRTVNPAWTRTLEWSSLELLSKAWLDLVHPEDGSRTAALVKELCAEQPVTQFINRYRCKGGTYRWLEWRAWLEREAVYAVADDVTEAVTTKEALRSLSEDLSTTLKSIGDGVIATSSSGDVVRMNPVAEHLTGWSFAEARERPISDVLTLVNADTRAKVEDPVRRALRDGTVGQLPKRTLLARRDGTEIPIADSCAPIRAGDGRVSGAVLVFRDLTAQTNAEMTQAKLQKQLVFADRMAAVGTLAAGVAHEINNPLSFAVANIDMAIEEVNLTGGESTSGRMKELEETLREARQGVARVTKIVRGLKAFSRIEEERLAVIDLIPVIELSVSMASNEIRHGARLVKDYGKVPYVLADDARLGQVFINLLVNAAHAFQQGNADSNEIRIATLTDAEGRAVVEVSDTGVGIPGTILGRIFDPFFTTKSVGLGTGLGLAISHNIVTGMGGTISVKSEPGHGATFRVTLPAASATEMSAGTSDVPASSPPEGTSPGTVLVVDDEPLVGRAVCRTLAHHHVTVVTSARAALELFAAGQHFDVILSDLMMPGMSGMELYEELSRLHPEAALRVVFLTGGAFTPEADAFLARIANERLDKPFDAARLRELVAKLVERESVRAPKLLGAIERGRVTPATSSF